MFQTEIEDVPTALLSFQGRLVAGVGNSLRIYDIGKKKLLRKVEAKVSLFLHLPCQLMFTMFRWLPRLLH